jgi:hypothetical protein
LARPWAHQGHAGQGQGEEAEQHGEMQMPIEAGEAAEQWLVIGLGQLLVCLPFVARQEEADQPGQRMQQGEGQGPDQ